MTAVASLGQLKLRAVALLALVFVAGALAGAGWHRFLEPPRPPHPPGFGGPYSQLGMTREQQARAREIFEEHRRELDAILLEAMPRVRKVQDVIDSQMLGILTPEQVRKLQRIKSSQPPPAGPGLPGMGPPPSSLAPPPGEPPPGGPLLGEPPPGGPRGGPPPGEAPGVSPSPRG